MKIPSKDVLRKYLTFHYWSRYLRQQGVLTEKEYLQILSKMRSQYGIP